VVDRAARRLTYARAGHDRPLLVRARRSRNSAARARSWGAGGNLLGLSEERIDLAPGDRLVLYTDGLVDSLSPEGESFGEDRLKDFLAVHGDLPPRELCDAAFAELVAFQGGAEQYDDMAVLTTEVE